MDIVCYNSPEPRKVSTPFAPRKNKDRHSELVYEVKKDELKHQAQTDKNYIFSWWILSASKGLPFDSIGNWLKKDLSLTTLVLFNESFYTTLIRPQLIKIEDSRFEFHISTKNNNIIVNGIEIPTYINFFGTFFDD